MTTHEAGQAVGSGLYVSFRDWDLQIVSKDGDRLEGEGRHYRHIPLLMLVVLAPVIGGIYAMAFPAIIFGAFARVLKDQVGAFRLYRSGETVGWGVYVGLNRLCVSYASANEQRLEGDEGTRFVRVPTWLVVLGSPLIGGLYVVLFPFLLGAALFTVLLGLVAAPFRRASEHYGRLTTSRWEPSAAYLDHPDEGEEAKGAPKAEGEAKAEVEAKAEGEAKGDSPLADLEAEVEARRAEERERAEERADDREGRAS